MVHYLQLNFQIADQHQALCSLATCHSVTAFASDLRNPARQSLAQAQSDTLHTFMQLGRVYLAVLVAELLLSLAPPAAARILSATTCLTSTSLQFTGQKLGEATATTRDGCCDACIKFAGCQMWTFRDRTTCDFFGVDKVCLRHTGA